MKTTIIITAKIQDEIMELIREGRKRYEIRDEPFNDAQAIRYVSSRDGRELGMYRITDTFDIPRSQKDSVIEISAVGAPQFHRLFPNRNDDDKQRLWIAHLGTKTNVAELLKEDESL